MQEEVAKESTKFLTEEDVSSVERQPDMIAFGTDVEMIGVDQPLLWNATEIDEVCNPKLSCTCLGFKLF